MSQTCAKCSRVNPMDAVYCFFDGMLLSGQEGQGPLRAGTNPFPNQFVFPTGEVCKNFDQFALACQNQWTTAVELLRQGFLTSFFGGMGRADLALAAKEAAAYPDQDRGLDGLLAKIPTEILQPPKLKVEPSEINLGQIQVGVDRAFDLHLSNLGMRLVYGSVGSDSKWLSLGDGPGSGQKIFQFGTETTVSVKIKGQHLRAGVKPILGDVVVESNAGLVNVAVRAEVPIKPFPAGSVLAGCTTPRKIAEKARTQPGEAAPLFAQGKVAEWYKSNGWAYPVQGPAAEGLGAVQQFFEALGLAKAPKVEVSVTKLSLTGDSGQQLSPTIKVSTQEKKVVYAYATCDQAWVKCGKVDLNGRVATITLDITVPPRPREVVEASVIVHGNGSQRFTIPLQVVISDKAPPPGSVPTPATPPPSVPHQAALTGEMPIPGVPPVEEEPAYTIEMDDGESYTVTLASETPTAPDPEFSKIAPPKDPNRVVSDVKMPKYKPTPWYFHSIPFLILVFACGGILLRDLFAKAPVAGVVDDDALPKLEVKFDYHPQGKTLSKDVVNNNLAFGLAKQDGEHHSKITFSPVGHTNSAIAQIDTTNFRVFGKPGQGDWVRPPQMNPRGAVGQWRTPDNVEITQFVRLLPGDYVEEMSGGEVAYQRYLETCLVRYKIENKSGKLRQVGFRVLLDTYIGENDGVPFTVPGIPGLVKTHKEFNASKEIPDFVMALEKPDLKNPGTVVQLTLKVGSKLEPPEKLWLFHYTQALQVNPDVWDPFVPARGQLKPAAIRGKELGNDSGILMYWPAMNLKPGQVRDIGYTYGLGTLASSTGRLALSVGGSRVVEGQLSVVATVKNPQKGETLTLTIPDEYLALVDGKEEMPVPPPASGQDVSVVTWRVRNIAPGDGVVLRVQSSAGAIQLFRLKLTPTPIF